MSWLVEVPPLEVVLIHPEEFSKFAFSIKKNNSYRHLLLIDKIHICMCTSVPPTMAKFNIDFLFMINSVVYSIQCAFNTVYLTFNAPFNLTAIQYSTCVQHSMLIGPIQSPFNVQCIVQCSMQNQAIGAWGIWKKASDFY